MNVRTLRQETMCFTMFFGEWGCQQQCGLHGFANNAVKNELFYYVFVNRVVKKHVFYMVCWALRSKNVCVYMVFWTLHSKTVCFTWFREHCIQKRVFYDVFVSGAVKSNVFYMILRTMHSTTTCFLVFVNRVLNNHAVYIVCWELRSKAMCFTWLCEHCIQKRCVLLCFWKSGCQKPWVLHGMVGIAFRNHVTLHSKTMCFNMFLRIGLSKTLCFCAR